MLTHRPTRSALRRTACVSTLGAVFSAGGLVALLGVGSSAAALQPTGGPTMEVGVPMGDDDGGPISLDDFLLEDEDGPDNTIGPLDVPILTSPMQPGDNPIFEDPILTIPVQPDDAEDYPIFENPIVTVPMQPDDTPTPTDPPVESPGDPSDGPTETLEGPEIAESGELVSPTDQPAGTADVAPFVRITSATVDCTGMVQLTYETGASPALAETTEHVVMFSPANDPTAVTARRLAQRPTDGVFTIDLQSPVAEGYRVFVVADFEPTNPDGVALVDDIDAAAPVDCAAAGPTG